jgi:hypothetical protein
MTIHLHLMLKERIREIIPPLPRKPSRHGGGLSTGIALYLPLCSPSTSLVIKLR